MKGKFWIRLDHGHIHFLKMSSLLAWGWNQNCQLGLGDTESRSYPQKVGGFEGSAILEVACGTRFSLALSKSGNVYSWGRGDDGQLGHQKGGALVMIPRLVQKLESVSIMSIAARGSHSLALSSDGRVFAWGRNEDGQLGLGTRQNVRIPTHVSSLSQEGISVTSIACSRIHSVAVSTERELYAWGCNDDMSTGLARDEPVLVPTKVTDLRDVKMVACGSRHTLVLCQGGTTSSLGGYSSGSDRSADAGGAELFAFGWGTYGQLGVGGRPTGVGPQRVRMPPLGNGTVTDISCGFRHSLAIVSDVTDKDGGGELWAWGWNANGQLGVEQEGETAIVEVPTKVLSLSEPVIGVSGGGRHTLVIIRRRADFAQRVFSFGRNDDGQLGIGNKITEFSEPTRARIFGKNVSCISAGWSHSAALLALQSEEDGDIDDSSPYLTRSPSTNLFLEQEKKKRLSTSANRSAFMDSLRDFFDGLMSFGNLDAGFAQFLNTLILLLNVLTSLQVHVGLDQDHIVGRIVPGATLTVCVSNMLFGFWADRKTKAEMASGTGSGNEFTAMPHGINTVLFFAFTMLIMAPVFQATGDSMQAYKTALGCCFILGAIELPCVFLVDWMRKIVPRAAMMSAMAGVSLTFIAMTFTVQIFSNPAVGIVPMILIFVCYGSNVQLPYKIPAGLAALIMGTAIVSVAGYFEIELMDPVSKNGSDAIAIKKGEAAPGDILFLPYVTVSEVFEAIMDPKTLPYLGVVVPLLVVNIVNNLSCIEGMEATGDLYSARQALALDAVITMLGALFGNPFPTCIYIGHGAFKSMGATGAYSYISGVTILLMGVFNLTAIIMQIVPEVAGVSILMWIGIVVTAQAFDRDESYTEETSSSKSHAAAVALGLLPALAAWCLSYVQATLPACGVVMDPDTPSGVQVPFDKVMMQLESNGVFVFGLIALSRGYLLSSIFLASTLVEVIDRKFLNAAAWMLFAACLSFVGAVHSFELNEFGASAHYGFPARTLGEFPLKYTFAYLLSAFVLFLFELREEGNALSAFTDDIKRRARKALGLSVVAKKTKDTYNLNNSLNVQYQHSGLSVDDGSSYEGPPTPKHIEEDTPFVKKTNGYGAA